MSTVVQNVTAWTSLKDASNVAPISATKGIVSLGEVITDAKDVSNQ